MKKLLLSLLLVSFVISSCKKEPQIEQANAEIQTMATSANKHPVTAPPIIFTQTNLFPEGVVYDPFNNWFYVSSVTRGDIGIVKRDGTYSVFTGDSALTSTNGLEIDKARKRLYVCNSPGSVAAYSLRTGQRIFLANLKALLPTTRIFINDIALDAYGNAYATNSAAPVIYKITPGGIASIFYQDSAFALPAGQFGFNGIEFGHAGYLLVSFSSKNQVIKFPLSSPSAYNFINLNAPLIGPDGLLLSKDGKELIVVNNAGGREGKVLSFASNDKWKTATLTDSFSTGPVFPTTATTDGRNVYVLYAYLNQRAAGRATFTIQPIPATRKEDCAF